jgi:tetratricopeptide (TPR) repeat protein
VTTLFALHPLRVESVTWISERKDVLSAFFFLLTLWMYARYVELRPDSKHRGAAAIHYVLALVCLALGLMSKAMVVTAPCVLILLDIWPLRRIRDFSVKTLSANLVEKIPFIALSLAFCLITFFVQKNAGTVIGLSSHPFSARLANAVVSYSRYLGATFWPHELAAFYPYHQWAAWQVAAATLLFVLFSVIGVINLRRRPYLFVGWFVFAGMLVPVIGLSQVGTQSMADRYTYLPHIGLLIATVWLAFDVFQKTKPAVLATVGFAAALACVPVTFAQIGIWRDSETLVQATLHRTTESTEANFFCGAVKQQQGQYAQAATYYNEALRLQPEMMEALCGLGNVYDKLGDRDKAAEQYERALKLDPTFAMALHCRGDVYRKTGKTNEAFAYYTAALKYKPDIAEAHYFLAKLLEPRHDMAGAIAHLKEAVRLKPDYTEALNDLAWALATQQDDKLRNGSEAARVAAAAVSLTHNHDPGALDTFAAALAEEGKFSDAIQMASTAMNMAVAAGDTNLVAEIGSRLKLYQCQRAYRE